MDTSEAGQHFRRADGTAPTSRRPRNGPVRPAGGDVFGIPDPPQVYDRRSRAQPVAPRQLPPLLVSDINLVGQPTAVIQGSLTAVVEALASAVRADRAELDVAIPPDLHVVLRWPVGSRPVFSGPLVCMAVPAAGWGEGTVVFRAYRRSRLFSRDECVRAHSLVSRCAPVVVACLHLPSAMSEARRVERSRLAVFLHQGPAHALATAAMDPRLRVGDTVPQEVRTVVDCVRTVLQGALDALRAMIALLRTPDQTVADVGAAIRSAVADLQRLTPVQFEVDLPDVGRLPEAVALAVTTVAIEALANSVRHSGAQRIRVRLWRDADAVGVEVADDGHGFDPTRARSTAQGGYGLAIVADEIRRVDGMVRVHTAPGRGTRVVARIPVRPGPSGRRSGDVARAGAGGA